MDYIRRHSLNLYVLILMIDRACHCLPDQFVEGNFPDQMFPHHLGSEEEDQIISCDFESACFWASSNHSDHSDWLVATPEQHGNAHAGTMPATDHSLGSSDGHFLLLNPSPAEKGAGISKYHLTSPVLPGSDKRCIFQLALYEAAPAAGNLTLLIKAVLSGSTVRTLSLNHTSRGDHRAKWEILRTEIGQIDEPFQVTLLYSSCLEGNGATVALDALEFIHCDLDSCGEFFHCENSGECIDPTQVCNFHTDCPLGEDEGFICSALPSGSYCSFEQDACGWSVSNQPSAWKRIAGDELLERERDPMQGATLYSTPGHFLFLRVRESNSLRHASVQSSLFSVPFSTTNACQMRFSLYLYGTFNGSLLVAIEEEGQTAAPLVWERKGSWTDDWEDVALQLTGLHHGFSVKVTALWEEGSNADVALDDIAVGAACFIRDVNSLPHMADLDHFLSPIHEPSASEVSSMTWWFNSCGASGPYGPTQAQCDSTYRNKNVTVTVGKEDPMKGVQTWRVPATNRYLISAYGAAGGKGARNHNKRNHGIFISAIFPLEKGDVLYILVGHQGEDACPGRNPETHKICRGGSSVIEDSRQDGSVEWGGGGGGGGGATYIFKMEDGEMVPLLIAAGGGGKAYLEDPETSEDQIPLEQYTNSTKTPSTSGQTGAAGGGGGWKDSPSPQPSAGKPLLEGAEGGFSCPLAQSKLKWSTFGGFGGGGGACTAGGGGGGYRGGDAAPTDEMTADGQNGVSFIHPMGEMYLQPLAAMESHGECEIKVELNCSHCQSNSCEPDEDTHRIICLCEDDEVLTNDNVTCISTTAPQGLPPQDQISTPLILTVVISTVASGIVLLCTGVILMWYRRKNDLHAVRGRLHSPEYKLSKIRSSTIMTDYNPNYCFAGKTASLNDLKEVPRKNITLLRALGHGAFGEVYEGQLIGMNNDNKPMQVAIKTLPEICSEQDEMDFLMEALIMSKFGHENIVRCIGVSLNILPRFILLELMTGGDMKSFLRQNRPRANQTSSLSMRQLLQMARDIALGCRYLEENHFIHRDIAARNCLLTCPGPERVAKIGDFGMARDIYRASYYRKGGRAMLPVKWMPPEAFMEGIFTCKTDTWSFGVLLWEIFSLGYMPYPCKTNQEVLEFVTSGGRMDPPKNCPGPVYRIMTQCWQHCPEHRPNFSTILERINYCSQDPDVMNTSLPVEYTPTAEDDGGKFIRPSDHTSNNLTPLLMSHAVSHDSPSQLSLSPLSLGPTPHLLQPIKPHLLHQRTQPTQVMSYREALEPSWAEPVPAPCLSSSAFAGGHVIHHDPPLHRPCSRNNSSSGSQKLKNKTKNLWNPTYGSWVLENFRGKKALAHTQSMPLSSSSSISQAPQTSNTTSETSKAGCGNTHPGSAGACSLLAPSPSCQAQPVQNKSPAVGSTKAGMDLAKLQTFPCGNVNYAYDEQSYEAESLPLVKSKGADVSPNTGASHSFSSGTGLGLSVGLHTSTSCMPKLLLKRHASYGHEDVRKNTKAEKPACDRDSGFSLSEDLSVTPI
eukprot:XP_011616029.1 PREDICTED: leukocyte tyrosine kinase receptor [Takifugu rubripes]